MYNSWIRPVCMVRGCHGGGLGQFGFGDVNFMREWSWVCGSEQECWFLGCDEGSGIVAHVSHWGEFAGCARGRGLQELDGSAVQYGSFGSSFSVLDHRFVPFLFRNAVVELGVCVNGVGLTGVGECLL